jgi:hypothetical protein
MILQAREDLVEEAHVVFCGVSVFLVALFQCFRKVTGSASAGVTTGMAPHFFNIWVKTGFGRWCE